MNRQPALCKPILTERIRRLIFAVLIFAIASPVWAEAESTITLGMRDTPISEVMSMLSRQNRVNILLGENVDADVSFSLYEVSLDEAIRSIANAAGFAVERRSDTYFVLPEDQAGKIPGTGFTIVRSLPVKYADVAELENKLSDYLSDFGNLTAVPERKLLMVEDRPRHVYRIAKLLSEIDQRPRQVMIEAKILEVKLNDEQSFGIDWDGFFSTKDGEGSFGLQGLDSPGTSGGTGFFFDYLHLDYSVALRALETDGRVRNLASPKVVTVENEEAEVIIGDRRGYRVTTTINQVTTESIEFLESGVILRVTPSIDADGKILLSIHPEVSNGTVDENGIPSQTTTEVTTRLLVGSGQTVFIGGLMRNTTTQGRSGIPILGRIPGIRWLFSNRTKTTSNTETIVLITPRLVDEEVAQLNELSDRQFEDMEQEMRDQADVIEDIIEDTFGESSEVEPAAMDGEPDDAEDNLTTSVESDTSPEVIAATVSSVVSSTEPEATAAVASPIAETSTEDVIAADVSLDVAPVEPMDSGRYVVNLHSDLAPVERPTMMDELSPDGFLYTSEADLDGDTWYRLRLGFFETEGEANAARDQFLGSYPSAWVAKVGPQERAHAASNGL